MVKRLNDLHKIDQDECVLYNNNNVFLTFAPDGLFVSGLNERQMKEALGCNEKHAKRLLQKYGVSVHVYVYDANMRIVGEGRENQMAAYNDLMKNIPFMYEIPSLRISPNGLLLGKHPDEVSAIWDNLGLYVELLPMPNSDGKVVIEGSKRDVRQAIAALCD